MNFSLMPDASGLVLTITVLNWPFVMMSHTDLHACKMFKNALRV